MSRLIRPLKQKFLLWAEPIGAAASVVIAVLAVVIAIMLDQKAKERDEAARRFAATSAIHDRISDLDSMQHLVAYAHKFLYRMSTLNTSNEDNYWATYRKEYIRVTLGDEPVNSDRWLDRQARLMAFISIAQDVYTCGWKPVVEQGACDQHNLLTATVPDLAWIYYGNLHGLYCDEHITEIFFAEKSETSSLYNLESMILASNQLALEAVGSNVEVYRSYDERGGRAGRYVRPDLDTLCSDT